jgi:hypothetical protein
VRIMKTPQDITVRLHPEPVIVVGGAMPADDY